MMDRTLPIAEADASESMFATQIDVLWWQISAGRPKRDTAMPIHYEHRLLITYAANIARRLDYPSREARRLFKEVASGEGFLDVRACASTKDFIGFVSKASLSDDTWERFRKALDELSQATSKVPPNLLARRLRRLGEVLGLTREDVLILGAWLFGSHCYGIEHLLNFVRFGDACRVIRYTEHVNDCILPHALGMAVAAFRQRLDPDAPLARTGLIALDHHLDVSVVDRLNRLTWSTDENADVRELLLGKSQTTELSWSDFDHLGRNRDDVETILRGALQRGARGVNILVYGPPGTGKTTFCQALAERVGVRLFGVGEADERGNEPDRAQRLAELRLTQNLLGDDRRVVLLLDEMEDVLASNVMPAWLFGHSENRWRGTSKVYLNRLLERTPAPTLWTTTEAGHIDPSILRRMVFALEIRLPPPRIRAGIWSRQLARHGIEASAAQARSLAEEFDATPGVAEGAAAAGELGAGGFELVRRSVKSLSRVLGCDRPRVRGPVDFDPALLNGDLDLAVLADRLERSGERQFSLCLQGPPGTGKSAFVRYLAGRMGMEVQHRRASDLLDMFVGQTERNIAQAFAEARDNEAFLIFDEADSLLTDRRGAHRSWEISQVNEMLTWMESHPLPFACTTNYAERLDSATLRRFVFKVTLGYLKPDEAAAAFRKWFAVSAPPGMPFLEVLTPGDFEVVRRKARLLGQMADTQALLAMLRAECDAKPGRTMAIGFANR